MHGFIDDIEDLTEKNTNFRQVLYTGSKLQLVLMALQPGEEIGEEVHADRDQFFRVEKGKGEITIDGVVSKIKGDMAMIVPAGARHNIRSTGDKPLKLYTIYGPPEHIDGTVHATTSDAASAHEHFDGRTSEKVQAQLRPARPQSRVVPNRLPLCAGRKLRTAHQDRTRPMAMKDILLQLTAYPVRSPRHAIEHAMAIAQRFDTRITAAICKVDLPDTSNYLARAVTGIAAAVAGQREKFDRSAVELAAEFRAAAFRDGQTADAVVLHSIFRIGSRTARCAGTVSSALTIITTASTASPPMARRSSLATCWATTASWASISPVIACRSGTPRPISYRVS